MFDIGVGYGTYGLYQLFPDAFYHLVEPTRESLPYMKKLARRLRCDIHPLALGDREGEAVLEIRSDIQGSTLLEEVGTRDFLRFDRVPMRRFDSLFSDFERPALCKIDVQGAELMVLQGMTGRLAEIGRRRSSRPAPSPREGWCRGAGIVRSCRRTVSSWPISWASSAARSMAPPPSSTCFSCRGRADARRPALGG